MRIAVALHVMKNSLLGEFRAYLRNIPQAYDLFITVPDSGRKARQVFPKARILARHPNRGMDIGGFFAVLPLILKGKYDVVLKLHSKSDSKWRKSMLRSLCGSSTQVRRCLSLLSRRGIGALGDHHKLHSTRHRWAVNGPHLSSLCRRWRTGMRDGQFAAGTMFWIRTSILKRVFGNSDRTTLLRGLNTPQSFDVYWYLRNYRSTRMPRKIIINTPLGKYHYIHMVQTSINTRQQAEHHWRTYGRSHGYYPNGLAQKRAKGGRVDGMIEHAYERFFGVIVAACHLRLVGV